MGIWITQSKIFSTFSLEWGCNTPVVRKIFAYIHCMPLEPIPGPLGNHLHLSYLMCRLLHCFLYGAAFEDHSEGATTQKMAAWAIIIATPE